MVYPLKFPVHGTRTGLINDFVEGHDLSRAARNRLQFAEKLEIRIRARLLGVPKHRLFNNAFRC